ncbi:MAG TPA: M48 family metalloprotease [Usitatibacter sp.]
MRFALLTAIALACTCANAQFGSLLDLGKKALDKKQQLETANKEFTNDEEIALGEGIAAAFLGAAPLHHDQNLQRYVNRVGRWVAMHGERPDLPWTFGVIDTETINAFAFPGGTVIVSSGLLKRLNSESELAGALAHEVAHVVKRHQIQAIQSQASTDFWTGLAQDVAVDRVGRSGGGALAQAAKQKLVDMGADLVKSGFILRPLDRALEYEADRMAIVIAARSGYDPYGLVAVLQMLAQAHGDGDGASVFATHPAPGDRITELERLGPSVFDRYGAQPQVEGRFKQVVGAAK